MKKKILGLALVALSLVAVEGFAQNPTTDNNPPRQENVKGKKDVKKGGKKEGKKECKKDGKMECKGQGQCPQDKPQGCSQGCKNGFKKGSDPYAGITLTDAQKSKLQQLDSDRQAKCQQMKENRKADRQRNDSIYKVSRMENRKAYLATVKEILTPDQYVVFLENSYLTPNAPRQKDFKKPGKGHGQGRPQGRGQGQQPQGGQD